MDEIKFVIKCFVFSCLLLAFSQVEADGLTLEARLKNFLVSQPVSEFVNQSAKGGVALIKQGMQELKIQYEKITHKNTSSRQADNKDQFKVSADRTFSGQSKQNQPNSHQNRKSEPIYHEELDLN